MSFSFQEKIKRRELLKEKIQCHYIYIADFLKESDIDSIVGTLFEKRIFLKQLVEDILLRIRPRYEKARMLLDNIMQCDEEHMLYFLELIQFVMPIVYEEITGNKAKRSLVDEEVYSNITKQSSIIRRSIQTLENVWSENFSINEKDFEDLKKSLLHAEKQIEKMWNAVTVVSNLDVASSEKKNEWKDKYDELMAQFKKSEQVWNEKHKIMNKKNSQLKIQVESLEAQVLHLKRQNEKHPKHKFEKDDESSIYSTFEELTQHENYNQAPKHYYQDENPYGSLQIEFIDNLPTDFPENANKSDKTGNNQNQNHPMKVTRRREPLPGTGQKNDKKF